MKTRPPSALRVKRPRASSPFFDLQCSLGTRHLTRCRARGAEIDAGERRARRSVDLRRPKREARRTNAADSCVDDAVIAAARTARSRPVRRRSSTTSTPRVPLALEREWHRGSPVRALRRERPPRAGAGLRRLHLRRSNGRARCRRSSASARRSRDATQYPPQSGDGQSRGSTRTVYSAVPADGWLGAEPAKRPTATTRIPARPTRLTTLVRYVRAPRRHRARGGSVLRLLRRRRRDHRRPAADPRRRVARACRNRDLAARDRDHRIRGCRRVLAAGRGRRRVRSARRPSRRGRCTRRDRVAAARPHQHR